MKKFIINEHGVIENPYEIAVNENERTDAFISWAYNKDNNKYYSAGHINKVNGGFGSAVSFGKYDKQYDTKEEAIIGMIESFIKYFDSDDLKHPSNKKLYDKLVFKKIDIHQLKLF